MPAVYSPCGVIRLLTNRVSSAALLRPANQTAHATRQAATSSARKRRPTVAIVSSLLQRMVTDAMMGCSESYRHACLEGREMRSVRFALVTMGLLGCGPMILLGGGADAQQTSPIPLKRMTVQGDFAVSEGVAADISGMACLPQGAPRKCLLINDENKNAQFATIDNDGMVVGDVVPLIGSTADPRTLGSPPDKTCEKTDDFKDLDGEGVAYAAPHFMSSVLTDADAQRESFDCLLSSSRGYGSISRDNQLIAPAGLWLAKTWRRRLRPPIASRIC